MAIIRNAVRAMERTLPRERVARARSEAALLIGEMRLADLRRKLGVRQTDLGSFSQSAISRLEARTDMKLSTLAAYLGALDLGMEIRAYRRNGKPSERSAVVLLRT